MDTYTIGIVVENEDRDILCHNNSFIIDVNISNKDRRGTIESKLEEILEGKPLRIESISKKIPKLNESNECYTREGKLMYLVKVYMYSDNSDFKSREYVLDRITRPLYKDYFLKYFIRYDKYNDLVYPYINACFMFFYMTLNILGVRLYVFSDNFWTIMVLYIIIPMIILDKFIAPRIVNYLIKYEINEKTFKTQKLIKNIISIIYCIFFVFIAINA